MQASTRTDIIRCAPPVIIAMLALLLSACGFQLRTQTAMPTTLQELALECDGQHYWALCQRIRQQLAAHGSRVNEEAPILLSIDRVNTKQRVAVIDSDASASEYELSTSVTYRLLDQLSNRLITNREVKQERLYRYNSARLIAVNREKDRIRDSLQETLADRIVVELAHFDTATIEQLLAESVDQDNAL